MPGLAQGAAALGRIEDFVSRGGYGRFIEGLLTVTAEPDLVARWEYDEETDCVIREYEYDTATPEGLAAAEERVEVNPAMREHLEGEAVIVIRSLERVALEEADALPRVAAQYLRKIHALLTAWERGGADSRHTAPADVLRMLEGQIRGVARGAALSGASRQAAASERGAPGGQEHRGGNPSFAPVLSPEQQQALCHRMRVLLTEEPGIYAPRRRGQVSEALKIELAREFGVSESTAGRYARKCLESGLLF